MGAALLLTVSSSFAKSKLELTQVVNGTFSAENLRTVTPLADGESYAQISNDSKKIVTFSYKTGQQTGVLFDVNATQGLNIPSFDNYILSPDGKKILIQTKTKRIYRRSFTAEYYIYTIGTRMLEKLSDGGPQQAPVWSNDGLQVAFVRNNNIYLVKLLYDNAESQVTKDGKWNEVINGVPDWVYEEEFGFNSAMAFNADGTMICWIRFDESQVKEYPLQLFKGAFPAKKDYTTYPGFYSYKYPKAGEVNSKVSVLSYDIKSHQTRVLQVPLDADGYIPRIKPTTNADKMIVYTMNRHQDVLNLYSVNPKSTVSQLMVKETVDKYVKEESMSKIQITDNYILLPSDRDGHMCLYLYNINGQLLKKLNTIPGEVTDIYGYDESTGNVYYQAAGKNPMNREVYVTLKNGKTQLLTPRVGWNSAIFSNGFKYFINQWSDFNTPYE